MSAAEALGLPPGVRFDPTGDELVEYYLLPRALGRPPAVPGIIIDDDTATATTSAQHPWKLLTRHRRTDDSEAYFFERVAGSTDGAKAKGGGAGARQDRSCGGGRWTWVGQKRAPDEALPLRGDSDGERVSWGKYSLNLQEGRRRKGGSTGWVMHEYTVAASPQCPLLPVKLCHVSFTGHGQKRQRVPDDDGEGQEFEPQATQPPHKRAASGSCMVTTATAMPNQELSEAPAQNQDLSDARAQNQEQQFPDYDYTASSIGHFWSSDAGFSQESSIILLDPSYPDDRSNHQEPFALDEQLTQIQQCSASQSQAYHQEQFMGFMNPAGSSTETHCAMQPASDLGSSQQPQASHPLNEEHQFSVAQLLGGISSPLCPPTTPAAYHEQQNIQSFPLADLPLSTDQESCTTEQSHGNMNQYDDFFRGWGDFNSFCDTSGIQDDDDMAAQTLAAVGCGGGSSWDPHFFYEQPAL